MEYKRLYQGKHVVHGKTLPKALKSAAEFIKENEHIIVSDIRHDTVKGGYLVSVYYSYFGDDDNA